MREEAGFCDQLLDSVPEEPTDSSSHQPVAQVQRTHSASNQTDPPLLPSTVEKKIR